MSRLFGRFILVLFLTLLLLFSSLVPHILHALILNFLTRKSISNQQQAVYEFLRLHQQSISIMMMKMIIRQPIHRLPLSFLVICRWRKIKPDLCMFVRVCVCVVLLG